MFIKAIIDKILEMRGQNAFSYAKTQRNLEAKLIWKTYILIILNKIIWEHILKLGILKSITLAYIW